VPQALVASLLIAGLLQLVVTRMVMGRAVRISAATVLAVVMIGTAVAGVIGAIFAIPATAALLSITDYLRQRDVLLRAEVDDLEAAAAGRTVTPGEPEPAR
jgi:predicted PurR-regulated permease PerM